MASAIFYGDSFALLIIWNHIDYKSKIKLNSVFKLKGRNQNN